jgi:hypothetical protein
MNDQDWGAWSADAVAMMNSRNRAWIERYRLTGASYVWDLNSATIAFDAIANGVFADLCVVGTASKAEGSFLWAWANEDIPAGAKRGLEKVRAFGDEFDLGLLTTPRHNCGRAEGLEALAIAGRVLDADGVWVDERGDLTLFFALFNFRRGDD